MLLPTKLRLRDRASGLVRVGCLVSCAALALPLCPGQEEAEEKKEEAAAEKDAAASEVPDYSKGLKMLADLGLPEMKGAEWIEVKGRRHSGGLVDDYSLQELGVKFDGAGWRLASGRFLDAGSVIDSPLPEGAKGGKGGKAGESGKSGGVGSVLGTMLKNFKEENPDKVAEAPDPGNLIKRDLKMVAGQLRKPQNRQNIRSSMEYGGFSAGGSLLIFAAQAHAAGHTDLANRLVHELFTATGRRKLLLDQAVSTIADSRYTELANAFFENHDWKAYYEGIVQLQKEFPRGWIGRYALAILEPKLKERADKTPPPAPSLKGVKLPAKGLELAKKLCEPPPETRPEDIELPEGMNLDELPPEHRAMVIERFSGAANWQHDAHPWVLQEPKDSPPKHPILAIKALGMDGVIILAALLDDETLTHERLGSSSYYSRSSIYGSSQSLSEKIKRYQQSMTQPTTRGDIAATLLRSVVPSGDIADGGYGYGSQQMDPSILRERAVEFWKKHKSASRHELLALYFSEGDAQQQMSVASLLATADDEESAAAFEKGVLGVDNLASMTSPVGMYLQRRKVKAKDFYEAYARKMRKLYGDMTKDQLQQLPRGWELANEGIEGHLKKLGVHVGTASVREIVDDALKPEERDREHWSMFSQSLPQLPISDVMLAMAEVMDRTTADDRAWLLGSLCNMGQGEESEGINDKALAAWRALLEDERPVGGSSDHEWLNHFGIKQTRELAALALESNSDEEFSLGMQMHYAVTNGPMGPFLLKRAIARVDGGDIPPLISSKGLAEERVKEIAKLAVEIEDVLALKAKLDELTPQERVAWLEWYQNLARGMVADLKEMPKSLLKARNTIVEVDESGAELAAKLKLAAGSQLEAEKFEAMARTVFESRGDDPSLALAIMPTRMGLGLKLEANRPAEEQQLISAASTWQLREANPNAKAYIVLGFGYGGNEVIWQVIDDELKMLGEQPEDGHPSIEQYKSFMESERLWTMPLIITVLGKEDIDKHRQDF